MTYTGVNTTIGDSSYNGVDFPEEGSPEFYSFLNGKEKAIFTLATYSPDGQEKMKELKEKVHKRFLAKQEIGDITGETKDEVVSAMTITSSSSKTVEIKGSEDITDFTGMVTSLLGTNRGNDSDRPIGKWKIGGEEINIYSPDLDYYPQRV
ncbi:MAG: hypothetical protein N4A38_00740 [Candidatus Gracilibacteria bacterium]|nr:hypothetical protein [Candidatus Gracilibacteria bacterium]